MGARNKRCVGGGHDGDLLTSGLQEAECIKEEGVPTPIPEPGGANRITTNVMNAYLTAPIWNEAKVPRGFTNLDAAERLVIFPICTARRRLPTSELLRRLDAFNIEHAAEMARIMRKDEKVRHSLVELILDISSIAASVLEIQEGEKETSFAVSKEFVEGGAVLARSIHAHTKDTGLMADLDRLVELGRELVGTRLAELSSKLDARQK